MQCPDIVTDDENDRRVREGRGVAAGAGLAVRAVAGRPEPDVVDYNGAISACEECAEWLQTLSLPRGLRKARLELVIVSVDGAISARKKGLVRQQALSVLGELIRAGAAGAESYRLR